MAIRAISSVNFEGKAQTNSGNPYDKTSIGKYAGMGVGAAIGAGYPLYAIDKALKDPECKNFVNDVFKDIATKIQQDLGEAEITAEELAKLTQKSIKTGKIIVPIVTGTLALLAGLGLGAVVDGVINHNRAKKADAPKEINA